MSRFLQECKVTTKGEATTYLIALAKSPFAYHLDDGAEACLEDKVMAAVLDPKTDAAFKILGSDMVWEIYGGTYFKKHQE